MISLSSEYKVILKFAAILNSVIDIKKTICYYLITVKTKKGVLTFVG